MKFTCKANDLKDLTNIADSLTQKKSTIFSDRYMKLKAMYKRLEISAGTAEYFATLYLNDVDIKENGVACAEDIAQFIKVLADEDVNMTVSSSETDITVRRGNRKSGTMPAVPIANFVDRSENFTTKKSLFSLTVAEVRDIVQAAMLLDDETNTGILKSIHFDTVLDKLVCYLGNRRSMFKYELKNINENVSLTIPSTHAEIIKSFLNSKQLQANSSVEFYKTDNHVLLQTSVGELKLGTVVGEYPMGGVLQMFDMSNWEEVEMSVNELAQNFVAAEALFHSFDNVICNIKSQDDLFYVTNAIKTREYEGILDNPNKTEIDIFVNAENLGIACKVVNDATFIIKRGLNKVSALGLKSKEKCLITVPIFKEKVSA